MRIRAFVLENFFDLSFIPYLRVVVLENIFGDFFFGCCLKCINIEVFFWRRFSLVAPLNRTNM